MKKRDERNPSKVPMVKIDHGLDQYEDKVFFPEKVDKANEALKKIGLPKVRQKAKA